MNRTKQSKRPGSSRRKSSSSSSDSSRDAEYYENYELSSQSSDQDKKAVKKGLYKSGPNEEEYLKESFEELKMT